jgi:hypothetical protein
LQKRKKEGRMERMKERKNEQTERLQNIQEGIRQDSL